MTINFNDLFEIINFKNNEKLLKEICLLRQTVFCVKKGQFGNVNCSECLESELIESDPYEKESLHSLIFYKPLKKYIGSVRLIFPSLSNEKKLLPIEVLLHKKLNLSLCNGDKTSRKQIAEVSGITILPEFRPKLAVLELLRAVITISLENKITHLYAALEPCVRRILIRSKVKLHPIGKVIDYNGQRQCYQETIQGLVEDIYYNNPLAWAIISDNGKCIPDFANITCTTKYAPDDEIYNYL